MKAHVGIAALAAAAALLSSSRAEAIEPRGLGNKGQLILSADRLVPFFSFTRSSVTQNDRGVDVTDSQTGAGLSLLLGRNIGHYEAFGQPINVHNIPRVAFDFTIIDRLTLGAAIAFGFGLGGSRENERRDLPPVETDAPTATALGIAPRVGYILGFSDLFGLWLRGGFGIYSVSAQTETVENNGLRKVSLTDTQFSIDLDPQFVLVPVEHFFFHFGPLVNIPVGGSRSVETSIGAQSVTVSNDIAVFHFGISAGLGGYIDL